MILTSQRMASAALHSSSLPPAPALVACCLPDEGEDSPRVRMDTRHLTMLTGNRPGEPNTKSFLQHVISCQYISAFLSIIITCLASLTA